MSHIKETSIPGLLVLERPTFPDERGSFREVAHIDEIEEAIGAPFKIVQPNHSITRRRGVRGIHGDRWKKLIYPVSGQVFAAIADIRPDSPTFGQVETFVFDDNHRYALFLLEGLGNSACCFGDDDANYIYLVDDYYRGQTAVGIHPLDPDLNIDWPVEKPIISPKDQANPTLRQAFPDKFNGK